MKKHQYLNRTTDNARFYEYLETLKITNLKAASLEQLQQIFLKLCDDFFSHQITICFFELASGVLYLPATSIESVKCPNNADLSSALSFAQDLHYAYKTNLSCYFYYLSEVMEFYLEFRNFRIDD